MLFKVLIQFALLPTSDVSLVRAKISTTLQPVDSGFLLFVYLLLPLVFGLLNAWFPRNFYRISKKVGGYVRLPVQLTRFFIYSYIISLLVGGFIFLPYGLEAGVWRKDGCPYFFSNRACVEWFYQNKLLKHLR